MTYYISVCCGAEVNEDYMICSDCLEHLGDEDIEEINEEETETETINNGE